MAVVDARTWATLQRLGSIPAGSETKWQRPAVAEAPPPSPFVALSQRKLVAARMLADNGCTSEAVPLLTEALKLALVGRARRAEVPDATQVVGWVFGELRPAGLASAQEAMLVLQLQGLTGLAEVPEALIAELTVLVAAAVG